jgi:hypothetical protein
MQVVYAPRGPWDPGTVDVPLISLTIQHGRTQEEARRRLETAVHEVSARFGTMLRRVEWAADRNRVKLEGVGFWIEMWVDTQAVHATGDAPILGRLLGGPLALRLKQIVEQTFQKQLP